MNNESMEKSTTFDLNYLVHSFLLLSGRWLNKILSFYDDQFTLKDNDAFKVYSNLAIHYRKKGKIEKAVESTKKALNLAPDAQKDKLMMNLADLYALNGNFDDARLVFTNVLKKKPDSYESKIGLGDIYARENDFDNSIKYYQEALLQNSKKDGTSSKAKDHRLYYKVALIYDKMKNSEEAIKHLKTAVELCPTEIKYYQHLGFIYESNGQHEEAVPCFKKVMELENENEDKE